MPSGCFGQFKLQKLSALLKFMAVIINNDIIRKQRCLFLADDLLSARYRQHYTGTPIYSIITRQTIRRNVDTHYYSSPVITDTVSGNSEANKSSCRELFFFCCASMVIDYILEIDRTMYHHDISR